MRSYFDGQPVPTPVWYAPWGYYTWTSENYAIHKHVSGAIL